MLLLSVETGGREGKGGEKLGRWLVDLLNQSERQGDGIEDLRSRNFFWNSSRATRKSEWNSQWRIANSFGRIALWRGSRGKASVPPPGIAEGRDESKADSTEGGLGNKQETRENNLQHDQRKKETIPPHSWDKIGRTTSQGRQMTRSLWVHWLWNTRSLRDGWWVMREKWGGFDWKENQTLSGGVGRGRGRSNWGWGSPDTEAEATGGICGRNQQETPSPFLRQE